MRQSNPETADAALSLAVERHRVELRQFEYRLPLLMQVLGGFSATRISLELNLTTAVVHGRLLRAREQLQLSAN